MPEPSRNVLVIESDPEVADVLGELLSLSGCTAQVATSGREGLEVVLRRAGELDAVFLDASLPYFLYLRVAEQIHAVRRGLPIVLMTGPLRRGLGGGAREHFCATLSKPFRRNDLEAALASLG